MGPVAGRSLVASYADGRIKLHVTRTGLALRRRDPLLLVEGAYRSNATGAGEHAVAFERARGEARLVCVVPRLPLSLAGGAGDWPLGERWSDARIELGEPARWNNLFTGEHHDGSSLALRDVLGVFPVAWLASE